jgi:hypothetical protein
MKRIWTFIVIIMSILYLVSCKSLGQMKLVSEETMDYDIESAVKVVEEKERLILDLSLKEKITPDELFLIQRVFDREFAFNGADILAVFVGSAARKEVSSDVYIEQNTFYPTIFHECIEVTGAVIHNEFFEASYFNTTTLVIDMEYNGDDERMQGWQRTYTFERNRDGGWELDSYSSILNFEGEEFNAQYLDYKEAFSMP